MITGYKLGRRKENYDLLLAEELRITYGFIGGQRFKWALLPLLTQDSPMLGLQ